MFSVAFAVPSQGQRNETEKISRPMDGPVKEYIYIYIFRSLCCPLPGHSVPHTRWLGPQTNDPMAASGSAAQRG